MDVVKFLESNSLEELKSQYALKIREYPDEGLIVLNYSFTSNDRLEANQCRGLILSTDFRVISRSFDRFFNYNERKTAAKCNDTECYAIEKIDGSLIKIYHFNDVWHVSTRGSAFAEVTIASTTKTYKQAVFEALSIINAGDIIDARAEEEFQRFCRDCDMDIEHTYILELTGKDNRIVTEYNPHKYELWLLGIRRNTLVGEYVDVDSVMLPDVILRPKPFIFANIKECAEEAKNLRNLQEGFVVYNRKTFEPFLKVKSPSYVVAHNCATDITDRRILTMIVNGESTEFVGYFPQHKQKFDEHSEAIDKYFVTSQAEYENLCKTMKSDHDFAVFTKKTWSRLAILTFKNKANSLYDTFLNWPENKQCKFLLDVSKNEKMNT